MTSKAARPEIRSRYDKPLKVAIDFSGEEKITKDSFRDECDINFIMARYDRTGQLPDLVARQPQYGDFADVPTFMEALETVQRAETAFAALPAHVRKECDNDPAVFLERVQDPAWAVKHELALPIQKVDDLGEVPEPEKKQKPPEKRSASEA